MLVWKIYNIYVHKNGIKQVKYMIPSHTSYIETIKHVEPHVNVAFFSFALQIINKRTQVAQSAIQFSYQ